MEYIGRHNNYKKPPLIKEVLDYDYKEDISCSMRC